MKNLRICLVLCLLSLGSIAAGLPDITVKELVDLIRLQENRIQSFQIKYRLNSGEYSEKGELVPGVIIDCEYARDISKEHRFFHEKWVKEDLDRKYAYNGKTGTNLTLKLPDEPGRMYGKIMPEIPEQFSDRALWKPDWSGYGFDLEGYDTLSSAIRNALKVEVIKEKSNGDELYKVMFEVAEATGEKIKFVDKDGATKWRPFGNTYVAWLSPQMGFQAVKIEALNGWHGEKTHYVCSATDFREISPGIWFPYRIERYGSRRNRGSLIEIEDIAINEKASVVSRLEFPTGTHVEDEIAGIDYRVTGDLKSEKLDRSPKTFTLYLTIGLLLISGTSILIFYKYLRGKQMTRK